MPFFVLFALLLDVTTAFTWDPALPDGTVHNVCAGRDIDLPWNFSLTHGERVEDVQWMFRAPGRDSEDIAVLAAGHFLVLPAFAGRVERRGEAGIALSGATLAESGNYSVLVNVESGGTLSRYRRTAWVQMNSFPRTVSGALHVELGSRAFYDNAKGSWNLLLTCGQFLDLGYPPVEVLWTLPDGHTDYSSYHNNSAFSLLINPGPGGNYTCRIIENAAFQCLPGSSVLRQGATITVDRVEASFLLLQSALATLKTDNEELRNNNQQLNNTLTSMKIDNEYLRINLTSMKGDNEQLRNNLTSIQADVEQLRNNLTTCLVDTERLNLTAVKVDIIQLQNDLTALKNNTSWGAASHIGFHAMLSADTTLNTAQILTPWSRVTNYGSAFDVRTGYFTAPVSGLYFFIASTGSSESDHYANVRLMADGYSGTLISEAWLKKYSDYWSMGSVHAVLHLDKRQRAWLMCHYGISSFDGESTSFSGFLISAD